MEIQSDGNPHAVRFSSVSCLCHVTRYRASWRVAHTPLLRRYLETAVRDSAIDILGFGNIARCSSQILKCGEALLRGSHNTTHSGMRQAQTLSEIWSYCTVNSVAFHRIIGKRVYREISRHHRGGGSVATLGSRWSPGHVLVFGGLSA